jgi:hypothetical protein
MTWVYIGYIIATVSIAAYSLWLVVKKRKIVKRLSQ